MNIKHIIIICVVMVLLIVGTIFVLVSNIDDGYDDVAVEDINDEENQEISITLVNNTGKEIKELYLFTDKKEDTDEIEGEDILDGVPMGIEEGRKIYLQDYNRNYVYDITAIIDEKEYELEYTLGNEHVFDDSILKLTIVEDKLSLDEDLPEYYEETDED